MKNRTHIRTARPLAFLLLVAIVAALASLSFYPDSATYAQTETSETLEIPALTATSTGTNTVELSWTAVTGAVRYELLAWQDSVTGWQRLDDGSLTSTSYTHGGLTADTTYWYAVRAVNAGGATSAWSEYANATVAATQSQSSTPTPTASTQIAATLTPTSTPDSTTFAHAKPVLSAVAAAGAVELSWTAVTGAVRYELLAWQDSVTGWQRLDDGSLTSTSYTHGGGLTADTTYWYAVRAVDASSATSAWSEYANATVAATQSQSSTPTPTPTASTQIAATLTPTSTPDSTTFAHAKPVLSAVAAAGAVELSWTAVTGAVRYELLAWQDSVTGWQRLDDGSLTSTSYTHGGLTADMTYWYVVRAVDAGGATSAWSEYANATVSDGSALAPTATPTATPTITPSPTVAPTAATTEREALVALYNATNGPHWYDNTNWLSDKPLRQWYGVNTDSNGRVTHLSLSDNNLGGFIPAELGNLVNLTHLQLYNSRLIGSIPPELGNLANLTHLRLYNTRLSGSIPSELGNLTNLRYLSLFRNRLSGSIPPELGNLANLTHLSLNSNRLSGSIPAELGNLANLTHLQLFGNELSGSIPPELGNLTQLYWLSIGHNQFSGTIPAELGNLTNLTELGLYNNQLTGSIPSKLGNLNRLDKLLLRNNQLSGSIPAELGNLASLRYLGLSNNQLSGSIPAELGNLANLHWLYLNDNRLNGSIPAELGNSVYLTELRLGGNQFSGCVPAVLRDMAARNDLASLGLPFCAS